MYIILHLDPGKPLDEDDFFWATQLQYPTTTTPKTTTAAQFSTWTRIYKKSKQSTKKTLVFDKFYE